MNGNRENGATDAANGLDLATDMMNIKDDQPVVCVAGLV
jgi:hypothetical protein